MTVLRPVFGLALLAWAAASPAAEPLSSAAPATRLDDLAARLGRLEEQSRSQGLLNLLNQVEALKAELARQRGAQEELAHQLAVLDQRQKEVLADYDARLKELRELASRPAPTPPAVLLQPSSEIAQLPVRPPQEAVDPEVETRAYEAALGLFKAGDHEAAVKAFHAFLATYPASSLAGNACYWLGMSHFALADHKAAVGAQQRLLRDYPQHAKVPDAMVNLARAQIQLGETEAARSVLEQVVTRYPASRSAELAKKILSLFK